MPRRPFTTANVLAHGVTSSALRWAVHTGRWQRVMHGVLIRGTESPTALERALATLVVSGGVASHSLAAAMYELDGVKLLPPFVTLPPGARCGRRGVTRRSFTGGDLELVNGYWCTNGLRTLLDLAAVSDDTVWEQALECALRKKLVEVAQLNDALAAMGASRTSGVHRIRRVLALRTPDAPPTESLLETLMVQLIRTDQSLPAPQRQVEVFGSAGNFIARVDLAWPDLGVFLELDGEHHKDQPVYDARRETAIVATTGWLPGRFTWTEVTRVGQQTVRRVAELLMTSRRIRTSLDAKAS